jgi:hypothetical protein
MDNAGMSRFDRRSGEFHEVIKLGYMALEHNSRRERRCQMFDENALSSCPHIRYPTKLRRVRRND